MSQDLQSGVMAAFKAAREQEAQAAAKAASDRGMALKAVNVDDLGVITFIGGAIGDAKRLDLDGEFVEKGDLLTMAYDFCAGPVRTFKANHDDAGIIEAELVGNWAGAPIIQDGDAIRVLKADEALTKDMVVKGICIEPGAETHWFLQARTTDEAVLKAAKEGNVTGGSWGAIVTKKEVA